MNDKIAATVLLSDPCLVILVKEGEHGYWEHERCPTPQDAYARADTLNDALRISPAEREALFCRSIFPHSTATAQTFADTAKPLAEKYSGVAV